MCNAIGLTHAIIDFSALFIPIPLIWNLKISIIKKFWISFLLLAGIFASISSILRLQCVFDFSGFDPNDPIRSMWLPWVYYFTELPIAIICCSAPSMPPVVKRLWTSAFGKYTRAITSRGFGSSKLRLRSREAPAGASQAPSGGEGSDKDNRSMELQTYHFVDGSDAR